MRNFVLDAKAETVILIDPANGFVKGPNDSVVHLSPDAVQAENQQEQASETTQRFL